MHERADKRTDERTGECKRRSLNLNDCNDLELGFSSLVSWFLSNSTVVWGSKRKAENSFLKNSGYLDVEDGENDENDINEVNNDNKDINTESNDDNDIQQWRQEYHRQQEDSKDNQKDNYINTDKNDDNDINKENNSDKGINEDQGWQE